MSDKVQLIKEEIVRLYNLYELSNDYQRMGAFSTILDFIDSLPEEPASEDLKYAAYHYANNLHMKRQIQLFEEKDIATDFIAGAEWQKKQMMKDAVDAFVNTYENTDDSNYVEFVTEQSPYKFKKTEKCKLIIVKEEQQ